MEDHSQSPHHIRVPGLCATSVCTHQGCHLARIHKAMVARYHGVNGGYVGLTKSQDGQTRNSVVFSIGPVILQFELVHNHFMFDSCRRRVVDRHASVAEL